MKFYPYLLGVALSLLAAPARAQYEFKDAADGSATYAGKVPDRSAGLAPYTQRFDLPAASTVVGYNADRTSKNYSGVYASFTLDALGSNEFVAGYNPAAPTSPNPIAANDGATTATNWYHFGDVGSLERAFGGIGGNVVAGGVTYPSGVGYIGVRLKNSSTVTIRNLSISYAMEQWYNSSISQAASCKVDYLRTVRSGSAGAYTYTPASITSLVSGTWTPVNQLKIDAPSTSAPIAERNGNSATNRRTAKSTLADVNLLPGEEIMVRFNYVFDARSNGNGMTVDDVVITPETNVYYSTTTGDLDDPNSWWTGADGTGTHPASFTAANQTFYVLGSLASNRVQRGTGWTVGGTNSKIVVGTPASPAVGNSTGKSAVAAALLIDAGNKTVTAPLIDLAEGSALTINQTSPAITLGYLAPTSTVEYSSAAGATHAILPATYGNLKLSGAGSKALSGVTIVAGTLDLSTSPGLTLGNNDLTLLRPATLTSAYAGSVLNASSTAYVITSGSGRLRQSVPNTGTEIVFPVGTATSYTPAKLKQATTQREDVYGVRVLDNAYGQYTAGEAGIGTAIAYQNVNKTWLVDEEVANGSDVTMALQWNKTDATADFVPAKAHINHYTNGGWDKYPTTLAFTTIAPDVYSVARSGISSFSPFAVSSRGNGVLPVELVSFSAQRQAGSVLCAWATASEKNNAAFEVQRSRTGREFEVIGTVSGQGTSTRTHRYEFEDAQAPAALAYYRLRQVDRDGQDSFSPVVAVRGCTDCDPLTATVVPNPGTGKFELRAQLPAAGLGQLTVRNALGQVVLTQALTGAAGFQRRPLDLEAQPAGVYLVEVVTPTARITRQLVKQ